MIHDEEAFIAAWNETASAAHQTAKVKGWWEDPRTDGECIALMHSELSEALEGVRRPGPDRHCPEFDQVSVELADVVIRIMDFAEHRELRVGEALIAKMAANQKREYRHGGAKL